MKLKKQKSYFKSNFEIKQIIESSKKKLKKITKR